MSTYLVDYIETGILANVRTKAALWALDDEDGGVDAVIIYILTLRVLQCVVN